MSVRWHTLNYDKQDGHKAGTLANCGFWLHGTPRLILLCRAFGHRPVVDGYGPDSSSTRTARWVACRRCGIRPNPQGDLNADEWSVGDRYTGPFDDAQPPAKSECFPMTIEDASNYVRAYIAPAVPGPWPTNPTSTLGGQVVLGTSLSGASIGFKVGNPGSENVLSAHLRISPIFALYLHADDHGQWIQRRLNPRGYDSRVVELDIGDGRLSWKLWAKRDEWSKGTPRWQDGSTVINPLDRWLGPVRHAFEKVGPPTAGVVRMPEGDSHEVTLQLEKVCTGRKRGRKVESWSVDWNSRAGIPFRNHAWKGDEVFASSVAVTGAAMDRGMWPEEACAQIAAAISRDRSRYGWRAPDFDIEVD